LKKSPLGALFDKERNKEKIDRPTGLAKHTKQLILAVFFLFFLLYLNYKPYTATHHTMEGGVAFLFFIYHFIINQTLGIVHEGGHGVCYILPCPQFIMVLNGTLFQWLFPLGIGVYYRRRGNQMAFYAGLFILGISMDYTSWYMSTAHEGLHLPASKSFLGVDALHDFNYLFSALGLLESQKCVPIS